MNIRAAVQPNFVRDLAATETLQLGPLDQTVLTSFVVDIYVASTACPVFSIAPDSSSDSFRLNPFRAAPRSAWSCA